MGFTLTDLVLFSFRAIFGFMILDFLVAFIMTFWKGNFNLTFILNYLKDILYYILPLYIILYLSTVDPTGWILTTFYFILAIAVVLKYVVDIIKKFKS